MPFPEDDPFEILDCALRSRYLSLTDIPNVPFWNKLPGPLQNQIRLALSQGHDLVAIRRMIGKVRKDLLGENTNDLNCNRNKIYAPLVIGLMYHSYLDGKMTVSELLESSFHKADSYTDCGIAGPPFLWLQDDFAATGETLENQNKLAMLFKPFINASQKYIPQLNK